MTDIELLVQLIQESGMPKTVIAERSGITRDRLYKILNGVDVKAVEIEGISRTLKLNKVMRDKVFFAQKVVEQTTL